MKKALFAFFISFFYSLNAAAEDTGHLTVIDLEVWNNSAIVAISPSYSDNQSCARSNQGMFIIREVSDPVIAPMVSTLLAGASMGKKIEFSLDGCGGGGYDFPRIARVRVFF